MNLRKRADEIFAWALAQRSDDLAEQWRAHSFGAAKVAERIAEKIGLDSDKAYAMGLLHDVGRYQGIHTGMRHIIIGYQKLMDEGLPEIARICLTHSFNPKEKVAILDLQDDEEEKFVKEFVSNVEYDDYDRLIQLADFMSGAHGVTTIERRFCSVLYRHNFPNAHEELSVLYRLREYFSEKCKMDIYDLFPDELSEAPFRGIPGDYLGNEFTVNKRKGKK